MNLGNISLSIVPVPQLFMNRTLNGMDTFKVSKKKNYFTEKDLMKQLKDINFANNPRYNRKYEDINRGKCIPPYRRSNSIASVTEIGHNANNTHNTLNKEKDSQQSKPENLANIRINSVIAEFENFEKFANKTDLYMNEEFGKSLKDNLNTIIDRINSNYDLNKWTNGVKNNPPDYLTRIDSRVFTNTNYNSNSDNNDNGNQTLNFQKTLLEKISSLKMDDSKKEAILSKFMKTQEITKDMGMGMSMGKTWNKNPLEKFNKTFQNTNNANIPHIKTRPNTQFNTNQKFNQTGTTFNKFNQTGTTFKFNENLPNFNQTGFSRFSDTRQEFSQMKAEKVSFRRKENHNLPNNDIFDSYNNNSHHHRNCSENLDYHNYKMGVFAHREKNDLLIPFLK